ncbi:hypothetical protein [Thermophagus xiamenensis]|uniref:Uncharacterized protein n=1 Tax=Thermophagus xiamenensis TaxID=385682 RepID=A0A1I2ESX9_9BACT|nr:hypothetical protein [Thermophagus xiamenensis]SFE96224.1 hypothetical protein SAMN05444380_12439 [Thermophagus xiamenensis]
MDNIHIQDKKDSIVLTISKKGLDKDYLVQLVKRLETENLIYQSGINENNLRIAEDIKSHWWKNNKHSFLGTSKE